MKGFFLSPGKSLQIFQRTQSKSTFCKESYCINIIHHGLQYNNLCWIILFFNINPWFFINQFFYYSHRIRFQTPIHTYTAIQRRFTCHSSVVVLWSHMYGQFALCDRCVCSDRGCTRVIGSGRRFVMCHPLQSESGQESRTFGEGWTWLTRTAQQQWVDEKNPEKTKLELQEILFYLCVYGLHLSSAL